MPFAIWLSHRITSSPTPSANSLVTISKPIAIHVYEMFFFSYIEIYTARSIWNLNCHRQYDETETWRRTFSLKWKSYRACYLFARFKDKQIIILFWSRPQSHTSWCNIHNSKGCERFPFYIAAPFIMGYFDVFFFCGGRYEWRINVHHIRKHFRSIGMMQ